jgi:hypothetical protein
MVAVERASRVSPRCFHGTEYKLWPTLTWMSGPTLHRDHSASTNGALGSGASFCFSTAPNTAAGAAPSSGRQDRRPATSAHQRTAAACICSRLVNSRPRQNESRIYGIGRSTCALSRGFLDRAGSTRQP